MISNLVVDNLSIAFPSDENEREMEGGAKFLNYQYMRREDRDRGWRPVGHETFFILNYAKLWSKLGANHFISSWIITISHRFP